MPCRQMSATSVLYRADNISPTSTKPQAPLRYLPTSTIKSSKEQQQPTPKPNHPTLTMDQFWQYVRKSSTNGPAPQSSSSSTSTSPPRQTAAAPTASTTSSSILRKMSATTSTGAPIILNGGGLLLRVAGLGQQFDFDVSPTATTLGDLKREIEVRTSIPAPYQRLVAKKKIMEDDTLVLGSPTTSTGNNGHGNGSTTTGIGLENRTKILLFHSPLYEQDREGIEKLILLSKEIERIDTDRQNHVIDNKTVRN